MDDMEKREREEGEFRNKLRNEGHTCIVTVETYPSRTTWCNKSPCVYNFKERGRQQGEFRAKLKREGHTCIRILESYPSQTDWCGNKVCTGHQ
jgi:uncharacterized protein YegP (UPF0339 family)